ncbi:SusC/RagA family TonB-linked outer membrane protein [Sphingobacterium mizutaii]|uniref:SusC/RagA family TonB-linked outer membrane protein n=1 Tax=Sphingobacterium mizutaii TaxID=1010 RepID=UPI001624C908|nr:TonB-dependent receptor [Sphingobacterium mizutaii]MBV2226922.1 TonB-dependent receptor [Sphingobacterium mizutaii]
MKHHLLTTLCVVACTSMQVVNAQQIAVAGKVSGSDGTPLVGVTVSVKGTTISTSTNENGLFSLNADHNATLVVSYIGYTSQEIPLNGRKAINITLNQDDQAIDEVMVVAYGTAKKSSFTGSAATVNYEKEAKDIPVTSFEQALTGRIPGVQINTTSGQAGSTSSIRVRGIGSMNASNEPLYVVDGVPVVSGNVGQMSGALSGSSNNIMATINPNDIESISILKDAAAASLYGSRAANGVVIITTKSGKAGKPKIDFRTSYAVTPNWATDNYKPGNPQEQIQYFYQIFHDYRTSNGYTQEQANQYALNRMNTRFGIHGYEFSSEGTGLYDKIIIKGKTDGVENRDGQYFDWNDALFRTGKYQTNDLAVSGASDKTKYYSSLSYTTDKGRAYTNEFERIGGRLNFSQKLSEKVEFATNFNLNHNNKEGYNDTRNTGTNYMYLANNLLFPFYWPTDYKTGKEYTTRYNSLGYNPLYYDKQWENNSKTLRIVAAPSLTVKFLPELTGKTIFSYDNAEVKDHLYYSPLHYHTTYGATANGTVFEYSTNYKKLISSSTLNYNKTFATEHTLDLLVGFEAEKNETNYQFASGSNLPSSSLHTVATAGIKDADAYMWGNNMMSVFSRAEYNFKNTYFLSGSLRRDGNSRLGPDTRWGNFWSLSAAWNLKNESFISDIEEINLLKLKASYGTNGTLPTSNFGWRSLASYGYNYMDQPGGILTTIADKDLKWEKSHTFNVGAEFGLFNNRLYGTVEYFNRDSKDLLQDVNISLVTGFNSTLLNVGEINNKGLEISIGGDLIKKDDFRWSANVNTSFLKSKVSKLYGGKDITWWDPTGGDSRVQFMYKEGEDVYSYYMAEWAGVDPSNGKPMWYTNDGTEGEFLHNGRGATNKVSDAKQVIVGSPIPKAYGGFNTDIEYKGFSLGLNFTYKIGGKLFDAGSRDVAEDGYYWERIRSYYAIQNVWTPDNTDALYPFVSGNDPEDGITRSTRHLYDASFLRLKNVNVSYRLPSAVVSKIGFSNARIFFNGTNLLTASKFKWADPEVNQFGTRGWETPFGKTYTFGLEVSL